jgi:hypothetical protein
VLELPPRVSAPPPLPGGDQTQSGLIAAPLSAPLGEPAFDSGGRSRTPLVVAIAALLGFIAVGGAVTFFGRPEPTVVESGVTSPEPGGQAPGAAPADPGAQGEGDDSPTAEGEKPKSPSELAPATGDAGVAAASRERAPARSARAARPRVVSPRVTRPALAPALPAPAAGKPTGAKPEPKPETKSDPGVDLSNPYR